MYLVWFGVCTETLPRVALVKDMMSNDTKLLTWGEPYEAEYLRMMGIGTDQVR
jgi:hypothetical protein